MMALRETLRKEVLLQWRGRVQFAVIFAFGATALLLFSFAIGPDSDALRQHAAGFLWLALMLSSTLTLSETFRAETEHRALEGLLLLPTSDRALFYAKAIANWAELALLGGILIPITVVLYNAGSSRAFALFGIILLGTAGLAAPGTMYGAMAAGTRAKQLMLPLLLFPLVVPVLLAAVKATTLLILGDPMEQLRSWCTLLVAFDAIYWSLCGLLFGKVVEE